MNASEIRWNPASSFPEVKPGRMKLFLVTVRRPSGTRVVELAHWANDHWLEWDDDYVGDDIDDDGGKKWTGWLQDLKNTLGDLVAMSVDGAVTAWAEIPPPSTL